MAAILLRQDYTTWKTTWFTSMEYLPPDPGLPTGRGNGETGLISGSGYKERMSYKPDTKLRKAWFVPGAMAHPAKGHLGLWWELVERYTEPGQTILDPMAGIGSTLIATMMGRNVICNEMEMHFLEPMGGFHCDGTFPGWEIFDYEDWYSDQPYPSRCHQRRGSHSPHWIEGSWQKMQTVGPMLGYQMGDALIIRGDARMLPLQSADCVITSPPWEDSLGTDYHIHSSPERVDKMYAAYKSKRGKMTKEEFIRWCELRQEGYTHPVSAVISSPPYEDAGQGKGPENHPERMRGTENGLGRGYTRPVDAVVTSPPYEESLLTTSGSKEEWVRPNGKPQGMGASMFTEYSPTPTNIGNLRGQKYWEAMTAVYRECHRVLIHGGVMVLVVKGYTRNKQYQDLPGQTADLIESQGFRVYERWTREVPLSFWRTLQKQNGNWDEALRFEHIIAAKRLDEMT